MPRRPPLLTRSLALALLLAAGVAQALTLQAPAGARAAPGEAITLIARLANDTSETIEARLAAELPAGWRLLLTPAPVTLAPGGELTVALPVHVPAGVGAGDHAVTITATGAGETRVARVPVTVAAVRLLSARVASAPASVLPERFEVVFQLTNRGNVPERLALSATSNHGLSVELQPAALTLSPGESASVRAAVPPLAGLERPARHALTLTITPEGGEPLRATATTEVIATSQPERLAYVTFPVEVSLAIRADARAGHAGVSVGRFEARGSGPVTEAGDTRVAFVARYAPTPSERQFEVSVSTPDWRARVGEQKQRLGPLQPQAAGFGVSLHARSASLYGLLGAHGPEAGFSVSLPPVLGATFSARGAFGPDLALVSAHGDFPAPLPDGGKLTLELEAALDLISGVPAAHARFTAAGPGYALAGALDHRQPGHQGESEARTSYSLAGRAQVAPRVSATAQHRATARGAARGGESSAGLQGSAAGGARWGVRYQFADGLLGHAGAPERSVSLSGSLAPASGSAFSASLAWTTRWPAANAPRELARLEAAASAPLLGGRAHAGVKADYDLSAGTFSRALLTAAWRGALAPATAGHLLLEHDLAGARSTRLALGAAHDLADGASASATLDARTSALSPWSVRAELGVRVPFEVRVAPRDGVSAVSGRLLDDSGAGVAGVVVHLAGFTAVTRADGTFTFPAIPAGAHTLLAQGLEPSLVAVPALPLRVTAPQAAPLTITVAAGASVRGQVRVAPAEGAGASALGRVEAAAPASLAGVRVLLVSDSEEREALTSTSGAFEFGRLPPGDWRVALDPASVPAGYAAAQAGLRVVTLPGGTVYVALELQVVRREIRFTGGGELGH